MAARDALIRLRRHQWNHVDVKQIQAFVHDIVAYFHRTKSKNAFVQFTPDAQRAALEEKVLAEWSTYIVSLPSGGLRLHVDASVHQIAHRWCGWVSSQPRTDPTLYPGNVWFQLCGMHDLTSVARQIRLGKVETNVFATLTPEERRLAVWRYLFQPMLNIQSYVVGVNLCRRVVPRATNDSTDAEIADEFDQAIEDDRYHLPPVLIAPVLRTVLHKIESPAIRRAVITIWRRRIANYDNEQDDDYDPATGDSPITRAERAIVRELDDDRAFVHTDLMRGFASGVQIQGRRTDMGMRVASLIREMVSGQRTDATSVFARTPAALAGRPSQQVQLVAARNALQEQLERMQQVTSVDVIMAIVASLKRTLDEREESERKRQKK